MAEFSKNYFEYPTKAIMQKNFKTLKHAGIAYHYGPTFNKITSAITEDISIKDFIEKIIDTDLQTAAFLERVALALHLDFSSTDIPKLVWSANILNGLTNNIRELSDNLQDLFFSLSQSPAYSNVSPSKMRDEILSYFNSLEEEMIDVSLEDVKDYLNGNEKKYDNLNTYTKKQLDTFIKIADKKLGSLRKTMDYLSKILTKKSKGAKTEGYLEMLAEEYKVELTTIDEQPITTLRLLDNVTLLFDAVHDRYDEISRCKDVFKKLRAKMGTNLDIAEENFNSATIGDTSHIAKTYQEKVIKDFYLLVKADPKLTLTTKFRNRNDIFRMAELKERAMLTAGLSNEFYSLLQGVELTTSQKEKYAQDKIKEIEYYTADANDEKEIELN